MRKALIVLILVLLPATVLGASFSESAVWKSSSSVTLELETDLPNATVYFYNVTDGKSLIGKDSSSPFETGFSPNISGYEKFELEAVASNASENRTEELELYLDTEEPFIDTDSFGHERNSNGSIAVEFYGNDSGELDQASLIRIRDSEEETVMTVSVDGKEFDSDILDPNTDGIYDEALSYKVRLKDRAGNIVSEDYSQEIYPQDKTPPVIDSSDPESGSTINNKKEKKLEVTVEDQLSGLKSVNLTILDDTKSYSNVSGRKTTVQKDISSLDDKETFFPTLTVRDKAGNTADRRINFTVDRTPPDITGDLVPDQEYLTETAGIGIDVSDSDVSDVEKIDCLIEGEKFGSDGRTNSEDVYSCGEINPENYGESEKQISARFYDKVGNFKEVDIGEYIFDTESPEIEEISLFPEYTDRAPTVNISAFDHGSGLSRIFYSLEGEEEEDGPEMYGKDDFKSFEPDIDSLENGNHELEVYIEDKTGKISETESREFYLNRTGTPKPELVYPNLTVDKTDTGTLEVEVANRGSISLLEGRFSLGKGFQGSSEKLRVQPGERVETEIEVSTARGPGIYRTDLTLSSKRLDEKKNLTVTVRAGPEERKKIRKRLSNLSESIQRLEARKSEKNDTYSRDLLRRIGSKLEELRELESSVEESIEDKRYYSAADRLELKPRKVAAVEQEFRTAENIHTRNIVLMLLGLVVLVGGSAGTFYLSRSRVGEFLEQKYSVRERLDPEQALFLMPSLPSFSVSNRFIDLEMVKVKSELFYYKVKKKYRRMRGKQTIDWR